MGSQWKRPKGTLVLSMGDVSKGNDIFPIVKLHVSPFPFSSFCFNFYIAWWGKVVNFHYGGLLTGTGYLKLLPTPNKTSVRSDKSNPQ